MGLKYAARAGGRGRARCAERAEPAHGRGSRWAERRACRGVYWGAPPPYPPICVRSAASVSEATHGRRCNELIHRRDDRLQHAGSPKRQPPPTISTKAVFSLESEGFLFDKTKRNLSEAPLRGPLVSAARSASASKRSLAQFGQSNTDSLFMCSTWPLAASMAYSYSMALYTKLTP